MLLSTKGAILLWSLWCSLCWYVDILMNTTARSTFHTQFWFDPYFPWLSLHTLDFLRVTNYFFQERNHACHVQAVNFSHCLKDNLQFLWHMLISSLPILWPTYNESGCWLTDRLLAMKCNSCCALARKTSISEKTCATCAHFNNIWATLPDLFSSFSLCCNFAAVIDINQLAHIVSRF